MPRRCPVSGREGGGEGLLTSETYRGKVLHVVSQTENGVLEPEALTPPPAMLRGVVLRYLRIREPSRSEKSQIGCFMIWCR